MITIENNSTTSELLTTHTYLEEKQDTILMVEQRAELNRCKNLIISAMTQASRVFKRASMNSLVSAITLVPLLSTGSLAEVFSPVEKIKLDICPQQKDAEAISRCFKRSTFDIIALSLIVEKSAKDNEGKAYANTKLGMIYEIDVGDKSTALSYYQKACALGSQKGCLLAKGLEEQ